MPDDQEPYAVTIENDPDGAHDWDLEERDRWMNENDRADVPDPTLVEVPHDG